MASEEAYFLEQARPHVEPGGEILASGYFRTMMPSTSGLGAFAAAAKARAYFVALTPERLIAIQTRAPATRKPLLENRELVVLPRAEIARVEIDADALLIHAGERGLALAPTLANKYFPRQGQLIETLSKEHGDGRGVDEIRRATKRKRLLRVGIALVVVAAAVAYGFWSRLQ